MNKINKQFVIILKLAKEINYKIQLLKKIAIVLISKVENTEEYH